jgi:hypothetical protein
MRHESNFAGWMRAGGNSVFVLPLGPVRAPEVKFSVVPDRLLDNIIDDALAAGVARLNAFLPEGVSIDITSVDLNTIRDQLRTSVADRLNETGVPVNPNDPVISAILARYAATLNGHFQTDAPQLETYIWRSQDDARVRAADAENDNRVFAWDNPPAAGHPGEAWNCRCTAVCRFSVSRPRFEDARQLLAVVFLTGLANQTVGQTIFDGPLVESAELRVEIGPRDEDRFAIYLTDKATGRQADYEFDGEGANDPEPFLMVEGRYCNTSAILLTIEFPWRHPLPQYTPCPGHPRYSYFGLGVH